MLTFNDINVGFLYNLNTSIKIVINNFYCFGLFNKKLMPLSLDKKGKNYKIPRLSNLDKKPHSSVG